MRSANAVAGRGVQRIGFTIPEVLAVMGVIALLVAVLLPALTGGKRSAQMADSMNRMRQIANWMTLYSNENRDHIVPSQFDYTISAGPPTNYPVTVRSDASLTSSPFGDVQYKGTWTDILWTFAGEGKKQQVSTDPADLDRYMFDSPDNVVYEQNSSYDASPFRAAAANTMNFPVAAPTGYKPFGNGAQESGLPGYFAANNYFDARPGAPAYHPSIPVNPAGRWYVTGQIKAPDRSMYLVDSFAGETIDPVPAPYLDDPTLTNPTLEVDFRYNDMCLMMYLDGHAEPEGRWVDICALEKNRRVRVRNLTRNEVLDCP